MNNYVQGRLTFILSNRSVTRKGTDRSTFTTNFIIHFTTVENTECQQIFLKIYIPKKIVNNFL